MYSSFDRYHVVLSLSRCRKLSKVDVKSMSFEEFIEIERTIDVGENDLVPVSIQDDEVSYAFWFQIFHVFSAK